MKKFKRILAVTMSVLMLAFSLSSCKVEKVATSNDAPSAKELMQKYIDNSKSKFNSGTKTYDLTKVIKDWLLNSKESTQLMTADLDAPFDFSASYGTFNGKLVLTGNASLLSIGMKNSAKLGKHNLFRIKCDYKYSLGGNFLPSVISFDGNVVCYIAVRVDGDVITGYYKLNDFDKNWYSFKITDVNNGLELYKEMEEKRQKDLDEMKKKVLEDENADAEAKKYVNKVDTDINKITQELIDHFFNSMIESAKMTNTSASIPELNIKDAYEVKCKINLFDDYMLKFIESYVPESEKENFDKLGLKQLKDKIIINTTTYFVKGEKAPVHFDGYSVVKEISDLKDFKIDYTLEDTTFKLNFNAGKFDSIMKNGSEQDTISDEIVENAKTVFEYKLSDAAGVSKF